MKRIFKSQNNYAYFSNMYDTYVNKCFKYNSKPSFGLEDVAYCIDHEHPCLIYYSFYDKNSKFLFDYID